MTETKWPTKLKIFTLWAFTGKGSQPVLFQKRQENRELLVNGYRASLGRGSQPGEVLPGKSFAGSGFDVLSTV